MDYKIGRLKQPIASAIHMRAADIYISRNQILHIANKHKKELDQLGIGALEYVKLIIADFNQIRKGTGDSILLVIRTQTNLHHTAAIDLNYCTNKGVWEVKTALPRKTEILEKKDLLWSKPSKS